jgi:hypothetical protein
MTEPDMMEQLSKKYVEIIANRIRNPIFFQKSDFLKLVTPLRNPIFFVLNQNFLNILET